MASTEKSACPCGGFPDAGAAFSECCQPVIQGRREARTAEELLRARYSAFARGDIDFIVASHHSRTRGELKRAEIEEWSKSSEWLGLNVVQKEAGGPDDTEGRIVFNARYRTQEKEGPQDHDHWEQSLFEKEGGHWRFLDAHGVQQGTYRRAEPKVGRNDPCPCGSGKKFKKCHAIAA
jgi:SEC-C motif domain protein